jgi:hypothetical protein
MIKTRALFPWDITFIDGIRSTPLEEYDLIVTAVFGTDIFGISPSNALTPLLPLSPPLFLLL